MLSLIRLTVLVLMDISEDVCLVNGQLWRRQAWRLLSMCGPEELIACMFMSDSDMKLSDSRLWFLPIYTVSKADHTYSLMIALFIL